MASHKNNHVAGLAMVMLISMLMVSSTHANHVSIANAFHSQLRIFCFSNKEVRQAYMASVAEIYYFAFDPTAHQYWECLFDNLDESPQRSAFFRMWGDVNHDGPDLGSCVDCNWSIDERGAYLQQGSIWYYKYSWP